MAEVIGQVYEMVLSKIGQGKKIRKLNGSAPQEPIQSDLQKEKASESAQYVPKIK